MSGLALPSGDIAGSWCSGEAAAPPDSEDAAAQAIAAIDAEARRLGGVDKPEPAEEEVVGERETVVANRESTASAGDGGRTQLLSAARGNTSREPRGEETIKYDTF